MICSYEPIAVAQGTIESEVFRYALDPLVYVPITAKTADAPLTITAAAHGAPDGWPVGLTGIGYDDLEAVAEDETLDGYDLNLFDATAIDANTLAFDVDLARLDGAWTNGTVVYLTPASLTSCSAVLKVYDAGGTVLASFTCTLDNTAKTITAPIDLTDPATLDNGSYTYALLFTDSAGNVEAIAEGEFIAYQAGSPPSC